MPLPAMTHTPRSELKNTGYEIFIGILSILSIVNLVLLVVDRSDDDLRHVLLVMNAILSAHLPGRLHLPPVHRPVATAATSSGTSAGPTCSPACRSRS